MIPTCLLDSRRQVVSADPAARLHEVSIQWAAGQTSQSPERQSPDSAQSAADGGIPAQDAANANTASVLAADGAHPATSSESTTYDNSEACNATHEQASGREI